MPEVSFPGDGQDGEQPPPAVPARDETGGMPDDDWDPEAEEARFIADLDAGRARIPEEWEIESRPPVTISLGDAADVDPAELAAMLGPDGLAELLRRLNLTLHPIAKGSCDHQHREDRYTPSRALKHLVRARTATCPAPGCGAQAYHNDLDHTVAYPVGATDECNLSPPCRRHHRVKQAPGWQLSQPEPGVMRWTTPSGRVYTTRPTVYEM